jgi:hypothetical protein
MKTGNATPGQGNELVFEQLLRVTKRASGDTGEDGKELSFDPEVAYKELMEDLVTSPNDPDVINITPEPSFTKTVPVSTPIPTISDNGGDKKPELSPLLKAMLDNHKAH